MIVVSLQKTSTNMSIIYQYSSKIIDIIKLDTFFYYPEYFFITGCIIMTCGYLLTWAVGRNSI